MKPAPVETFGVSVDIIRDYTLRAGASAIPYWWQGGFIKALIADITASPLGQLWRRMLSMGSIG